MAGPTAHDIGRSERLRAVTDNLFFWEGRRFVALGPVLMLGAFIPHADWLDERIANGALIAALVAATLVSIRMGRRYRAELGQVTPIHGAHIRRSRVKWILVYPAMFASLAADLLYALPLFLSGFVWATALVLYRQSTGGGRGHYLVLAAAVAALGLAPLAIAVTSRDLVSMMMLVLGAGYTAAVWLDDQEMRDILTGA